MRLNRFKLELLCGMLLTLAALPVFSQDSAPKAPEISKQALRIFGDNFQRKAESGEVDVKAPFLLEFRGTLTKAGKIDPATVKFPREEGDSKLIEIAKEAIEAVSDSGFLQYLSSLGSKDIEVVLEQDLTEFTALLSLGLENEARARTTNSGLKSYLMMATKITAERPDTKQGDKDALLFLRSAGVRAEGKTVLLSMKVSKADFHEIIFRQLQKNITVPSGK